MPDIAASISTSAVITVGTALTSTIDTFGDHDWYRVELEAGHTYSFALDGTILQGGSALDDPELTLRDAAGGWIVTNDDVEGGVLRNSMIRFTAVTSGTYYLDAGGFIDGYTGDFRITAFDVGATASLDQIATYLQIGYAGFAYEQPYQLVGSTFTYNLQMLSAAERTLAHLALQSWDDVGAFTFVETSGAATITFENWGSGFAESFGNSTSATVHISIDWYYGDLSINGYMYQTYVHEIGHALGLGHTGPYNGGAIYGLDNLFANDSVAASIMSYFTPTEAGVGTDETVMGPQMADIVAIGNLYGLSTSTRTGDTVYGFNSNAGQIYNLSDPIYATEPPAFTIYDNGGIDSLDASGYAQSQRIDLNAETWSDIGGKINNIAVARGVVVENAFGGSGADTIIGNSADNSIYGNAGVDHVYGNGGADVMFAGAGHDTLNGGDGAD
ncbi:MAG: M10 family metallopeptidase C-terminal domain-containing protein, partial [Hyphomicrobiaceae bacterium]